MDRHVMRLADLRPGDLVTYPSGFQWVMLRIDTVTRIFQWSPVSCSCELQRMQLVSRWSPPHTKEDWHATLDVTVSQYRR